MNVILVLITFPDEQGARQIGTVLIEKQLAACVNLLPGVKSIYRWQGQVCEAQEVLAVIKTCRENYDELEALVKSLHPYDCPEVLAIEPCAGAADYLQWVVNESAGNRKPV